MQKSANKKTLKVRSTKSSSIEKIVLPESINNKVNPIKRISNKIMNLNIFKRIFKSSSKKEIVKAPNKSKKKAVK